MVVAFKSSQAEGCGDTSSTGVDPILIVAIVVPIAVVILVVAIVVVVVKPVREKIFPHRDRPTFEPTKS